MIKEKTTFSVLGQPIEALWDMVTDKRGKLSPTRVLFYVFIGISLGVYSNFTPILEFARSWRRDYIESSVMMEMDLEKKAKLAETLPMVVNSLANYIPADLIAVFKYFPPGGKITYNKMLYYTGTLPTNTRFEDYQQVLTEKSHPAVTAHLQGLPFNSAGDNLAKSKPMANMYMYSCPIYNSNAEYDGVIVFYWNELPKSWDDKLIFASCYRASREIGIYF